MENSSSSGIKGGKREGAGRKPSTNPFSATPTIRMTPDQQIALKALGGAAWVRQQIEMANKKPA